MINNLYRLIIITVIWISSVYGANADIIYYNNIIRIKLKDSSYIYTKQIDSTFKGNLIFHDLDSTRVIINYDFIAGIDTVQNIKFEKRKSSKDLPFWESGLMLGTPAYLNICIGYSLHPVLFHLSGMYFSKNERGLQFDFGLVFHKKSNRYYHSISVILGNTSIGENNQEEYGLKRPYKTSDYVGLAYSLKYGILFGQLGISYITGRMNGILPVIQLGLLF